MSGYTEHALIVALAEQISSNLTRDVTVRPHRTPSTFPCITIETADTTYFGTFGADGLAELKVNVKLWLNAADPDSEDIAMSDFRSIGTGNGSSICDAINTDKTLGGLVDSCVCLEVLPPADESGEFGEAYTAVWPVSIHCPKVGAQA